MVCLVVIVIHQRLPNLFPWQSKMIFLVLLNISTQCQCMCPYVVVSSCSAGQWRGGECVGEHG